MNRDQQTSRAPAERSHQVPSSSLHDLTTCVEWFRIREYPGGPWMLTLNYEFKLKPTKKQIEDIENILTVCRKVCNYALRERKDWVNSRKC